MSSKSKSTTTKSKPRAKKVNGKKICPEGYNCPYKNEYQHQLEFTHDDTDNNNNNNAPTSSTKVFSGKGRTLNEDNNKKRKHDNNNDDDNKFPGRPYSLTQRPQEAEKITINKETNNDNNNKKAKAKVNDKKVNDNDDKIPCDICQAMVPFSSYGDHILTH